jgi:broad specificity phosphatase PhoE
MDDAVFARHGESETAARRVVGGDAPLTAVGQAQALDLGRRLAGIPVDICLTSRALRARETAALALAGRDVACEIVDDFGDIDFGVFAGGSLEEYRNWIASHPPDEPAPGGESRATTLRRFVRAYRLVLDRDESHVLVVAHGLTLSALTDERPRPTVAGVAYGSSIHMTRDELATEVARLERWCEAPAW